MLFWRWRRTPRATRRSLCSLFGDNWRSCGSWRLLHGRSSDSLSNRRSGSLNRCSGDNWRRGGLCWCSGNSWGSGSSFLLILLICRLLGLFGSLLGGIFAFLDSLLGRFFRLLLGVISSLLSLLCGLLDLALSLLLEILDGLRSLALLWGSCWLRGRCCCCALGAWLVCIATSGLSCCGRCLVSICLDLSLGSIFRGLLCFGVGCLFLLVSGLLLRSLSIRLCLVCSKLLLALLFVSCFLGPLLFVLLLLLLGLDSFLFGFLFIFQGLLLDLIRLFLGLLSLLVINCLLLFLLLGLLGLGSLLLGNLLLQLGGRLGLFLAGRASVLRSLFLALGGGFGEAVGHLGLLLLLLVGLVIGSLGSGSLSLFGLSLGGSLLSLLRLLISLLLLLLGDLFSFLLGLLGLLISLLFGLLLFVIEPLLIGLLLRVELLLPGLHLGIVGSFFYGIGGSSGGDLVGGRASRYGWHSCLFGTTSSHLLSATAHAVVKLLEHLGHSLWISSGLDVVEAIVGL